MSVSRLETWLRCPHAYFVRYVLGVDTIDTTSDVRRITSANLGKLIHEALEIWLREAIQSGHLPSYGEPWPAKWRQRLVEIGNKLCMELEERGLCGKGFYWLKDRQRIMADLRGFPDFDDEMRANHKSTPLAAELQFGMSSSKHSPVSIQNNVFMLQGSIDRIDATESGGLVVVDYKTFPNRRYRNMETESPKPEDGHMQLVLYAEAARSLTSSICRHTPSKNNLTPSPSPSPSPSTGQLISSIGQPTTSEKKFTSLRQQPVGSENDEKESAKNEIDEDYGEYWVVSSKSGFQAYRFRISLFRNEVLEITHKIVDGISDGIFPLRCLTDTSHSTRRCDYCAPAGLSTRNTTHASETSRDWKHKLTDPALSSYLQLVEL